MERLGYALEIFEVAEALEDFDVLFRHPLASATNPLNPTSVICLKRKGKNKAQLRRKSPLSSLDLVYQGDPLAEIGAGACAVFPIIAGWSACARLMR